MDDRPNAVRKLYTRSEKEARAIKLLDEGLERSIVCERLGLTARHLRKIIHRHSGDAK